MEKFFSINEAGCSIRCKLYRENTGTPRRAVLFGHGFGGHKDNRAAARFAERYLGKHKDGAVITFDWPCHGEDGRKKLTLEDCDQYITLLVDYIRTQMKIDDICLYATSFGGYLFLKYLSEHGNPFRRIALRCPALDMYHALTERILSEEDHLKLAKGKPVLAGFDRKIKIEQAFLDELKEADITTRDFTDYADDIMIIMGTKDELLAQETTARFAEDNIIEVTWAENADHRFSDPKIMDLAIHQIIVFFE